ncbi:hypothetical protein UY3_11266 [Chelonia mydas]|uniref:Uncharacterized protein n=1 Tax=Chelonia mydas TaxID=8469 RepID=M7B179_CHEMY|nr:hypothetical protein UY3_11266 [Chelonia mydas]
MMRGNATSPDRKKSLERREGTVLKHPSPPPLRLEEDQRSDAVFQMLAAMRLAEYIFDCGKLNLHPSDGSSLTDVK